MADVQTGVHELGKPSPRGGKGDRLHVNHTPPDSASSSAFQKRNQGVSLFIKQNETKTTFLPNETASTSQVHGAQVLNAAGVLERSKHEFDF